MPTLAVTLESRAMVTLNTRSDCQHVPKPPKVTLMITRNTITHHLAFTRPRSYPKASYRGIVTLNTLGNQRNPFLPSFGLLPLLR